MSAWSPDDSEFTLAFTSYWCSGRYSMTLLLDDTAYNFSCLKHNKSLTAILYCNKPSIKVLTLYRLVIEYRKRTIGHKVKNHHLLCLLSVACLILCLLSVACMMLCLLSAACMILCLLSVACIILCLLSVACMILCLLSVACMILCLLSVACMILSLYLSCSISAFIHHKSNGLPS